MEILVIFLLGEIKMIESGFSQRRLVMAQEAMGTKLKSNKSLMHKKIYVSIFLMGQTLEKASRRGVNDLHPWNYSKLY